MLGGTFVVMISCNSSQLRMKAFMVIRKHVLVCWENVEPSVVVTLFTQPELKPSIRLLACVSLRLRVYTRIRRHLHQSDSVTHCITLSCALSLVINTYQWKYATAAFMSAQCRHAYYFVS